MPPRKPAPREPGAADEQSSQSTEDPGESNVDEAIQAAQSGRARKIAKPRAPVAPSKVRGDPNRPAGAAVNAKREMAYADAMKAHAAALELGRLQELREPTDEQKNRMRELEPKALKRSVLTEQGWVVMPNKKPQGVGI